MAKAFITGASGFINANLAKRLLRDGHEVCLLLRRQSDPSRIRDIIGQVRVIDADLRDYEEISKGIHAFQPDYIFHSATYGSYPDDQQNEDLMIQTNIVGTYNMLRATADIPYRCFIYTGSSSEYGTKERAMAESDLLEPCNFYGVTKAAGTLLCQLFAKRDHKNIVIVRPFSVYGPYERASRLIPYTILKCLRKQEVHITSGEQRRDFVYVDDVLDVYLKIWGRDGVGGEIFNVGCGQDISVTEAVRMIFELTGADERLLKIGVKEKRHLETPYTWKADLAKLARVLGFRPQISFRDGLRKTIDWIKSNKDFYRHE